MRKVTFIGLVLCLYSGVLAFGGTEPVFFAPTAIGVLFLSALVLWGGERENFTKGLPWKGPMLLLAYVSVQSFSVTSDRFLVEEGWLKFLAYLCVFLLAAWLSQRGKYRYRLILAILGLGLFEALYGLIQYLSGWQQIFTYQKTFYTDRASGTYINANHFAGFLEMVLPLALGLALYRFSAGSRVGAAVRSEKAASPSKEGLAPAIFFFFVSAVLFLGILFSRSRMGIFSALVAVAAMGILWMSISLHRLLATLVLAIFLVGAGTLAIWVGVEPVLERYESVESDYLLRSAIWKDAASLIREHPFLGSGLGTFVTEYTQVQTTALNFLVGHAHNDYLEVATELGLLGAGLLFGMILMVLGRAVVAFYRLRQMRDQFLLLGCCGSILAILFHSFTDFNLQIPANAVLFAMILGLACGLTKETDSSHNGHPAQPT